MIFLLIRKRRHFIQKVSSSLLNSQWLNRLCTRANKGIKGDFIIKLEVGFIKVKLRY